MSRRLADRKGYPGPRGATSTLDSTVVDDGSSVLAPPLDDPEPPPDRPTGALPPVVAVIVTHDPGPWFEETLESLGAQTYPALSVLVIDAASDENPTARIASVLPTAYVRRLDRNAGFGAAANEVLGSVEGAAFYLFCHDDVALDPDAVRTPRRGGVPLQRRRRRAQARRLGRCPARCSRSAPRSTRPASSRPSPSRASSTRSSTTRSATCSSCPGGCTLVRADLFAALGGFDAGIDYLGEDLDLCWRAHVAGARVLVVPSAQVRHLEALGLRRDVDDRRRLQARHRLRTVLTCYRPLPPRPGAAAGRGDDRRRGRVRAGSPAAPAGRRRGRRVDVEPATHRRDPGQAEGRSSRRGASPTTRSASSRSAAAPASPPSSAARSARATTASRP